MVLYVCVHVNVCNYGWKDVAMAGILCMPVCGNVYVSMHACMYVCLNISVWLRAHGSIYSGFGSRSGLEVDDPGGVCKIEAFIIR